MCIRDRPHIVLGAALLQFGAYFGLTRSFLSLLIGHVVILSLIHI